MATRGTSLRVLIIMIFSLHSIAKSNKQNTKIPDYLLELYKNSSLTKIMPYNASSIRSMYFETITKLSNNPTWKLTTSLKALQQKKTYIIRDELRVYVVNVQANGNFLIEIKKSTENVMFASKTISKGWNTVNLNGASRKWLSQSLGTLTITATIRSGNNVPTGDQNTLINIGMAGSLRPYLVFYEK